MFFCFGNYNRAFSENEYSKKYDSCMKCIRDAIEYCNEIQDMVEVRDEDARLLYMIFHNSEGSLCNIYDVKDIINDFFHGDEDLLKIIQEKKYESDN